jgi:AmmeMemoRadiSam system protein B
MSSAIRPPAVAGTFYPEDAAILAETLRRLLNSARFKASGGPVPKAIVVPHAGYVYSGPVAASAYARVAAARGHIERVVVLGPAHTLTLEDIAASSADGFSTPLGVLEVDCASRDALIGDGLVSIFDLAHLAEHSLEVQLPFIQFVLGPVKVLPLLIGTASTAAVAQLLGRVWGGAETLVVVSTDLSHYHDRETARRLDSRTAAAIVARNPEAVSPADACGASVLRGLLSFATKREMKVELLDLRTSADTVGNLTRVVGYGSFALT